MKKILLFTAAIMLGTSALSAQTISFSKGTLTYSFPASEVGSMPVSGESVSVNGFEFNLNEWSSINISDSEVKRSTVEVIYSGDTAGVNASGNLAAYLNVTIEGAHVSIEQSTEVGADTCGEITYILKGESSDGCFSLIGSYKSTIELEGLTLTNPTGAVLDIQNGKRIELSAKNGTVNTLVDGKGSQKGAIDCKGHLEFKGKGVLNVTGLKSHAIYSKEYVEIKNLTLNILGAAKDGINCSQYFLMGSGALTINATGDDGLQTSYKDDVDREVEDTGTITISGGNLAISISADAAKCLKADGDVVISGGTLDLISNANGIWDSAKLKTKASACIGADGNVNITGGELTLKATGSGGKGISCDGIFTMDDGVLNAATTGGLLVYSNGNLNHNYTANAENIASDNKSSAKGIKGDEGVVINGGTLNITTASNNAEGIESKKDLHINGGTIFVKAYDDGINSSNDFYVSGGDLTVISIVGDGLDSNGNLTISGGMIRTMGSGGMEMGLDAATESGCAVYLTGGTVFAFGGSNTYPNKSGSTQAFVRTTGAISAGKEISIKSGDSVLASVVIPEEYNSSTSAILKGPGNGPGGGGWNPGGTSGSGSIMISCPGLVTGQSYTIVNGTTTTTASAVLTSTGR